MNIVDTLLFPTVTTMFDARECPASDVVTARQKVIWSVIHGGPVIGAAAASSADGRLKKLAAAVYGHRQIEPVVRLKVLKSLDEVEPLLRRSADPVGRETKDRVFALLARVSVDLNDVVVLPVRLPVLPYSPKPPYTYDFKLPTRLDAGVTLIDFERLAFDNRVIYQYYEGVTFATYFYQNAVYMSGDDGRRWQSRLAALVKHTGFADRVATGSFYEDTVTHMGVAYDTSFVPDFDVRALVPLTRRIGCEIAPRRTGCTDAACARHVGSAVATQEEALAYRAALDVRRVDRVPSEFASLFLAFPFLDGHYVRPDGTVKFLDVAPPRRTSVTATVRRVRATAYKEEEVADAARALCLDDVLEYALHADRPEDQGAALLVLRQMIGDSISVNGEKIRLPYRNEVERWIAHRPVDAADVRVLLPYVGGGGGGDGDDGNRESAVNTAVALVRDIADGVRSELAATFVCSSFHCMENHFLDVYDALRTDAERYVFFTLVLQQYSVNAYREYRDGLRPKFESGEDKKYDDDDDDDRCVLSSLESKYRKYSRPYKDATVLDRLDSFTERLVCPTDLSSSSSSTSPTRRHPWTACDPDANMETYEFVDRQLATLAATGDVELTPYQTASYITLCVT